MSTDVRERDTLIRSKRGEEREGGGEGGSEREREVFVSWRMVVQGM